MVVQPFTKFFAKMVLTYSKVRESRRRKFVAHQSRGSGQECSVIAESVARLSNSQKDSALHWLYSIYQARADAVKRDIVPYSGNLAGDLIWQFASSQEILQIKTPPVFLVMYTFMYTWLAHLDWPIVALV